MIEHMPEMVEAGIDSFKIEGRMKTALYVAAVTRTYRKAIDDYFKGEETYRANMDWYRAEIAKCTYRQYSTGFYFGKPSEENQIYDNSTYVSEAIYLGIAEDGMIVWSDFTKDYQDGTNLEWIKAQMESGAICWMDAPKEEASEEKEQRLVGFLPLIGLTQRNKFCVGDRIEVMKSDGRDISARVGAIYNEDCEPMESAPHAKQKLWVWLMDDQTYQRVDVSTGDVLRMDAADKTAK